LNRSSVSIAIGVVAQLLAGRAVRERKSAILCAPARTDDVPAMLAGYQRRDPGGFYHSVQRIKPTFGVQANTEIKFPDIPDVAMAFVSCSGYCDERL
jgi:hypothetical protein